MIARTSRIRCSIEFVTTVEGSLATNAPTCVWFKRDNNRLSRRLSIIEERQRLKRQLTRNETEFTSFEITATPSYNIATLYCDCEHALGNPRGQEIEFCFNEPPNQVTKYGDSLV